MEFPREYDRWKTYLLPAIMAPVLHHPTLKKDESKLKRLKFDIGHKVDRLWYFSTLEVIRRADVYNPGGKSVVPILYLVDSLVDQELSSLPEMEAFRLVDDPRNRFELLMKRPAGKYVVRDVEGYISLMSPSTKVRLGGNLTRGPDGNDESKVAIALFPVAHEVNYRTMRLSSGFKGYVFAFLGDEQSSPHFMRYSGLTGAAINSMLFNDFLGAAVEHIPFLERFCVYNASTTWSNGEVVQRGCGNNYGDGFLRPGFPYADGAIYMYHKIKELHECGDDVHNAFTRDWKNKFAGSLIPRGMEFNEKYIVTMVDRMRTAILGVFADGVAADKAISVNDIRAVIIARSKSLHSFVSDGPEQYWNEFVRGLEVSTEAKSRLETSHMYLPKALENALDQLVEHAQQAYTRNERVGSLFVTQPTSVDCIIDDFAVESQLFALSFVQSSSLAAASLAVTVLGNNDDRSPPLSRSEVNPNLGAGGGLILISALLQLTSILVSFGTITNVSRYRNRNEEWRSFFYDKKFLGCLKGVYCCMSKADRDSVTRENNPFMRSLDEKVKVFLHHVHYYDYPPPKEFQESYEILGLGRNDPSAIENFLTELATKFLPDTYYVNSYLQQELVEIYSVVEEMHRFETSSQKVSPQVSAAAMALFERMLLFGPRLEATLQRGEIKFGAFRESRLQDYSVVTVFKFVYSCFYPVRKRTGCVLGIPRTVAESKAASMGHFKPISTETLEIHAQMRALESLVAAPSLRRETVDMQYLYCATNESNLSSLTIVAASCSALVLMLSVIGLLAVLGEADINRPSSTNQLEDVGIQFDLYDKWEGQLQQGSAFVIGIITSPLIALLGVYYLSRQIWQQLHCMFAVSSKISSLKKNETNAAAHLWHIRNLLVCQHIVSVMRCVAAAAAAIALPWNQAVARGWYPDAIIAGWLSVGSAVLMIISVIFQWIVDYVIIYNLDAKLGEYVCKAFEIDIMQMRSEFGWPLNSTVTRQEQEREAWEYTAKNFLHKYRFDAMLSANPFSSIFQYIKSGLRSDLDLNITAELEIIDDEEDVSLTAVYSTTQDGTRQDNPNPLPNRNTRTEL